MIFCSKNFRNTKLYIVLGLILLILFSCAIYIACFGARSADITDTSATDKFTAIPEHATESTSESKPETSNKPPQSKKTTTYTDLENNTSQSYLLAEDNEEINLKTTLHDTSKNRTESANGITSPLDSQSDAIITTPIQITGTKDLVTATTNKNTWKDENSSQGSLTYTQNVNTQNIFYTTKKDFATEKSTIDSDFTTEKPHTNTYSHNKNYFGTLNINNEKLTTEISSLTTPPEVPVEFTSQKNPTKKDNLESKTTNSKNLNDESSTTKSGSLNHNYFNSSKNSSKYEILSTDSLKYTHTVNLHDNVTEMANNNKKDTTDISSLNKPETLPESSLQQTFTIFDIFESKTTDQSSTLNNSFNSVENTLKDNNLSPGGSEYGENVPPKSSTYDNNLTPAGSTYMQTVTIKENIFLTDKDFSIDNSTIKSIFSTKEANTNSSSKIYLNSNEKVTTDISRVTTKLSEAATTKPTRTDVRSTTQTNSFKDPNLQNVIPTTPTNLQISVLNQSSVFNAEKDISTESINKSFTTSNNNSSKVSEAIFESSSQQLSIINHIEVSAITDILDFTSDHALDSSKNISNYQNILSHSSTANSAIYTDTYSSVTEKEFSSKSTSEAQNLLDQTTDINLMDTQINDISKESNNIFTTVYSTEFDHQNKISTNSQKASSLNTFEDISKPPGSKKNNFVSTQKYTTDLYKSTYFINENILTEMTTKKSMKPNDIKSTQSNVDFLTTLNYSAPELSSNFITTTKKHTSSISPTEFSIESTNIYSDKTSFPTTTSSQNTNSSKSFILTTNSILSLSAVTNNKTTEYQNQTTVTLDSLIKTTTPKKELKSTKYANKSFIPVHIQSSTKSIVNEGKNLNIYTLQTTNPLVTTDSIKAQSLILIAQKEKSTTKVILVPATSKITDISFNTFKLPTSEPLKEIPKPTKVSDPDRGYVTSTKKLKVISVSPLTVTVNANKDTKDFTVKVNELTTPKPIGLMTSDGTSLESNNSSPVLNLNTQFDSSLISSVLFNDANNSTSNSKNTAVPQTFTPPLPLNNYKYTTSLFGKSSKSTKLPMLPAGGILLFNLSTIENLILNTTRNKLFTSTKITTFFSSSALPLNQTTLQKSVSKIVEPEHKRSTLTPKISLTTEQKNRTKPTDVTNDRKSITTHPTTQNIPNISKLNNFELTTRNSVLISKLTPQISLAKPVQNINKYTSAAIEVSSKYTRAKTRSTTTVASSTTDANANLRISTKTTAKSKRNQTKTYVHNFDSDDSKENENNEHSDEDESAENYDRRDPDNEKDHSRENEDDKHSGEDGSAENYDRRDHDNEKDDSKENEDDEHSGEDESTENYDRRDPDNEKDDSKENDDDEHSGEDGSAENYNNGHKFKENYRKTGRAKTGSTTTKSAISDKSKLNVASSTTYATLRITTKTTAKSKRNHTKNYVHKFDNEKGNNRGDPDNEKDDSKENEDDEHSGEDESAEDYNGHKFKKKYRETGRAKTGSTTTKSAISDKSKLNVASSTTYATLRISTKTTAKSKRNQTKNYVHKFDSEKGNGRGDPDNEKDNSKENEDDDHSDEDEGVEKYNDHKFTENYRETGRKGKYKKKKERFKKLLDHIKEQWS